METKTINQIKHISIEKVWGIYDFSWDIIPTVNVLIGENGSGKSTVVNLLYALLSFDTFSLARYEYKSITISTNLGLLSYSKKDKYFELNYQKIDKEKIETELAFVTTFDKPNNTRIRKDKHLIRWGYKKATSLDDDLHILMESFMRYQLDIYVPTITYPDYYYVTKPLDDNEKKIGLININQFFKILNEKIFKSKYKVGIGNNYSIQLTHHLTKQTIELYQLSSGEKQILIILLQALVTKNQPCIFLLDEPEVSLHLSIQEQLIDTIRKLNENAQLIIVTHSPSIVRKGYMDSYFEIENLKTYEK
jgi:predicted ATPase